MDWVRIYAIIFIAALFFSLIYTPLCKRLAQKFHFLDVPKCEQHKLHRKATPLLGGLAMFAAWLTTILGALAARCLFPNLADSRIIEQADGFFLVSRETFVLLFCAGLSTLLGVYDDKFSMKAWKKLIGQILIAMIAATWGGLTITLFIGIPIVTWCVTVFWIVLIFNAINFFDNMDGLAVGTCCIAFLFFTIAAAINQQYLVASLAAVSAGSALGFWCYNRAPASIFMGDSGSHFLGFLVAAVSCALLFFIYRKLLNSHCRIATPWLGLHPCVPRGFRYLGGSK